MSATRLLIAGILALAVLVLPAAAGEARRFDAGRFFAGTLESTGTIRTLGIVREDFTASFTGRGDRRHIRLDERFRFPDRRALQRWDLQRQGDGTWRGTVRTEGEDGRLRAPVPVEGREIPGGLVLDYDGTVPGGGARRLHFRHEMRLREDGDVSNRVAISRFGLPLARAEVVFRKIR